MGRRPHPRNARGQRDAGARPRLYGRHAVLAALANPEREFRKLFATPDALSALGPLPRGLAVQSGDAADLARLVPAQTRHTRGWCSKSNRWKALSLRISWQHPIRRIRWSCSTR